MNFFVTFVVAVIAVSALSWWYRNLRAGDRMAAIISRRVATGMLSSRAQLIDGRNHIPVALSLDDTHLTYENADFDASIDVRQIDEVEYGSDLVTGRIAHGAVLRIRSHGRSIEFVMDSSAAENWCHRLLPHRMNEGGAVTVV
jgi:hypothetical protein